MNEPEKLILAYLQATNEIVRCCTHAILVGNTVILQREKEKKIPKTGKKRDEKMFIDGRIKLHNRSSVTNLHQDFGLIICYILWWYTMQGGQQPHLYLCTVRCGYHWECKRKKRAKKIQKETRSRNQKVKSQERLKDVISTASLSTSALVLAAIHKHPRHFDWELL